MQFHMQFSVNEKLYQKNPELSSLGKMMIKNAIDLMFELGFEDFTFKKLAVYMETTEASIYRYFENKHKLLLYILNWYWSYMEFLVEIKLQNITDKKLKLKTVIQLLTDELPESKGQDDFNKKYLHQIVIREGSKGYLVHNVADHNKNQIFKPYKDLCARIAGVIKEYDPSYPYTRSLSTTLIETAHDQQYFSVHLPGLTDVNSRNKAQYTSKYLNDLVFRVLGA